MNTQSSDSDITTLPADSDRPVEDGVETEIPTDTTDTTDSSDNEQRIDADLSIAAITYNGGKLFRFYENNMDLIKLVDCSVDPTIESQDYNWYSNSDATLTLGLEICPLHQQMHRLAISLKWKSMKAHHLIFELALSALAVPLQTWRHNSMLTLFQKQKLPAPMWFPSMTRFPMGRRHIRSTLRTAELLHLIW